MKNELPDRVGIWKGFDGNFHVVYNSLDEMKMTRATTFIQYTSERGHAEEAVKLLDDCYSALAQFIEENHTPSEAWTAVVLDKIDKLTDLIEMEKTFIGEDKKC